MKFQGPYPAEFPSSNAPIDTRYVFVCIDTGMIPFIAEAMTPLLRRAAWATEEDFLAARQKLLEVKVALMNGCDSRVVRDGFVMLAKALNMSYSEALEAPLPGLSSALYEAEQADTGAAMDDIYRFGDLSPTQQTEQNRNFEALTLLLASLLTDGSLSPATISTLFATLKGGGEGATNLLQMLIDNGIGLNNNQNEGFLRSITGLIGGTRGLPPLDQP